MLRRLVVRKSAKSNGRRKKSSAKKRGPNSATETVATEVATVTTIGTRKEAVVITEIT